jgi:hypothetical protein
VVILGALVTPVSLVPTSAWAQQATLSGTVATSAGTGIPGAVVSVTPAPSGPRTEVRADSSGRYVVPNLAAGAYAMTVAADGYDTTTLTVTLASDETKTVIVTLSATLSLGDLGFSTTQTQGSAADQARLNRRSRMLRIHQELGLITGASFVATLLSSAGAGGRMTSAGGRDLHGGLGVLTLGLYATTASYALRAPKIPGTHTRGPIRLHKALAWIHGTGMILTPVLGAIAFDEESRGERVHGLASAHGAVAAITAAAYGAAMLSIAIKF